MIKISFICGALETGRDGVGDYTRRLAGELMRCGYEVEIISLNDRHIKTLVAEVQSTDGQDVNVLRIPSNMPEKERFITLEKNISKFEPDLISLQYVPYSFNSKGIPLGFFNQLSKIKTKAAWHVMLHEMWLDKPERKLHRVISLIQQFIIFTGVKKLHPKVINVSIEYNKLRLKKLGLKSTVLPLFGNISKSERGDDALKVTDNLKQPLKILYFGEAPRNTYLKQIIDGLDNLYKTEVKKVRLHIISKDSNSKQEFLKVLNAKFINNPIDVINLDFATVEEVSALLSSCNVGIVRSEPYLLGKSGSAIAMLEHDMPIWMPKWTDNQELDYEFRKQLIYADLQKAATVIREYNYTSLLPEVAQNFITQFN